MLSWSPEAFESYKFAFEETTQFGGISNCFSKSAADPREGGGGGREEREMRVWCKADSLPPIVGNRPTFERGSVVNKRGKGVNNYRSVFALH